MDKSYKIILLLLIVISTINISFAQGGLKIASKIPPTVKSAILPGWGEYELKNCSRGNFFFTTEIIGIVLTTFSFVKSNNLTTTYKAIASDHANVIIDGKKSSILGRYWKLRFAI